MKLKSLILILLLLYIHLWIVACGNSTIASEVRITDVSPGEPGPAQPHTACKTTATLSWTPPTTNTDGSTLTDLAGYIIVYGTRSQNYDNVEVLGNPSLTSFRVENLTPGNTYFFAMRALNRAGDRSDLTSEVSLVLPVCN